jgi:hypothetical protein
LHRTFSPYSHTRRPFKEITHEDCFDCCSLSTRPYVYGLWVVGAIVASHFAAFLFAIQVLGGLLLLSGYFVPLALIALAAELYNILAFHLTMAPESIPGALFACVLWVLVFLQYRDSFKGIFSAKPAMHP